MLRKICRVRFLVTLLIIFVACSIFTSLRLELGQTFLKSEEAKGVLSFDPLLRRDTHEGRIEDASVKAFNRDNKFHFTRKQQEDEDEEDEEDEEEDVELNLLQKNMFPTETTTTTNKNAFVNKCPFERISPKVSVTENDDNGETISCQQHQLSESACRYVSDYYKYEFDNYTCATAAKQEKDHEKTIEICKFNQLTKRFECDVSECGSAFHGEVLIHIFDWTTGAVRPIRQGYATTRELNDNIMMYVRETLKEGIKFMFLSCGFDEKMTQLLLLDNVVVSSENQQQQQQHQQQKKDKINVNIVLFDSTSRKHFFRSLKKTIHYLNEVNTKPDSKAEILDFELFQSIHGHTTENMFGLFNGKIFPKSITDKEKEYSQTGFENFLRFAKKHGYENFYQEDMCWEGFYGLNSDLGTFTEWDNFYKAFKANSSIDDTGKYIFFCVLYRLVHRKYC